MNLYVGIAKCLSEMSDTEIDRIAQVTQVQYFRQTHMEIKYKT